MDNLKYIVLGIIALIYSIFALAVFVNAGFNPNDKKSQVLFYKFMICSIVVTVISLYICIIYMQNILKQIGLY